MKMLNQTFSACAEHMLITCRAYLNQIKLIQFKLIQINSRLLPVKEKKCLKISENSETKINN